MEEMDLGQALSPPTLRVIEELAHEGRLSEADPVLVTVFNCEGIAARLREQLPVVTPQHVDDVERKIVAAITKGTAGDGQQENGLQPTRKPAGGGDAHNERTFTGSAPQYDYSILGLIRHLGENPTLRHREDLPDIARLVHVWSSRGANYFDLYQGRT